MSTLTKRYDFLLLVDVEDGNPNGDPELGNSPRVDSTTGHGLMTDACLKRHLRNYVSLTREGQEGMEIYVKERAILSEQQGRAYSALNLTPPAAEEEGEEETSEAPKGKRKGKKGAAKPEYGTVLKAQEWMCRTFFDVRTFGAVMALKENNAGQVRGPVQITFARSVDPITPEQHTITRMAVATKEEAEEQGGGNRTMGTKHTVPYGLYVARGFVSPAFASRTGFNEADLEVLWEGLSRMFEHSRSASRGMMSTRAIFIFEHASALGNAPAHLLFDAVRITRRAGVIDARHFSDYTVEVGELPPGVTLHRR